MSYYVPVTGLVMLWLALTLQTIYQYQTKQQTQENRISMFYQARPQTRRTGSASLTIPTLFLVSPDKLDVKRHLHGILCLLYIYEYCGWEQIKEESRYIYSSKRNAKICYL